jgi:hypothetical protein
MRPPLALDSELSDVAAAIMDWATDGPTDRAPAHTAFLVVMPMSKGGLSDHSTYLPQMASMGSAGGVPVSSPWRERKAKVSTQSARVVGGRGMPVALRTVSTLSLGTT